MDNSEITISVNNVYKSFQLHSYKPNTLKDFFVIGEKKEPKKARVVLNGISFDVKKGEAIALIGQNGCGKSTTLKLLTKILTPDSGSITMHGRVASLIELGAGFHPDMTGRENVFINASIFGFRRKDIAKKIDEIIDFSEIREFIDEPVRTYSSGMYMRLAFSVAVNVNPDILLIDEILAVGDAHFQEKCFNWLMKMKNQGITIVIVSHSLSQVKMICDRAIWLENGLIKQMGTPDEVCNNYLASVL